MLRHINTKYSGGYPVNVGDRYWSQDLLRDFRSKQYQMGLLFERLFGTDTCIIEGLEISQGTGHTLNITAGKAIVPFLATIPHRTDTWTVPPNTENVAINMLTVLESALANMTIASAVTDGVTINYVKLAYTETDGNTRSREKGSGTYSYEVIPSYTITVNDTAPTTYEVTLETFTSNGTIITFLGNEDNRTEISFDDVRSYIEVSSSIVARRNRKYIATANSITITLPYNNIQIGDVLEIFNNRNSINLLQGDAENIILLRKIYNTTKGTSGYLKLPPSSYTKLIYTGSDNYPGTLTKLSDPASLPTGTGNNCALSPDGQFLAVAHAASPYITIYSISGTTFTKLSDPASLPGGNGYGCAFSPDGQFLAVSHDTSPYITIYSISGTTFTKLSDPATLPAGLGYGCAFSPDGQFLAVAHASSPFITIYSISGTTFTKLSDPASLPGGTGHGPAFSSDGQFLTVPHTGSPYIAIYSISGTTFTKLSNPASLPGGDGKWSAFSPDVRFLAVAHSVSPFVTIYSISGTTFTKLSNPASLPGGNGVGCAFSPDEQFLAVAHAASPYITVYQISGTTFTKLSDPASLPGGNGNGCAFSSDMQFLAVAHQSSPYIAIYNNVLSYATKAWQIADIETKDITDLDFIFK